MPINFGRDIAPRQIQAIASYDYVDIAEGTGYVVFHGASTNSASGGIKYNLVRNGYYSNHIASGGTNVGTDDLKLLDVDFDVTFIKPQIIDGKSIINIPVLVSGNIAASTYISYVTVAVQKVSEGTETELFALTSGSLLSSRQSKQHGYSAIEAELPLTHFQANDTLRLQVQLYARGNAADTAYALMGFDPRNRTQSGEVSSGDLFWTQGDADLQFHVPFRLNT